MSVTTIECIRGCVRARRHLSDCDDTTCRGCEPKRAMYGRLCTDDHRRFVLMLTQAEIAERWLTGNLGSGIEAAKIRADHERVGGGEKEIPTPLNLAILDARDLLRDRLATWVDDLCEHSGLKGPEKHGVTDDAKYLLTWLSTVENLEWVDDWFEELAETMSDAHAVAPWRPAFTKEPKYPCPHCHGRTLGRFGGEDSVTCVNRDCKKILTPDEFNMWRRVIDEPEAPEVAG